MRRLTICLVLLAGLLLSVTVCLSSCALFPSEKETGTMESNTETQHSGAESQTGDVSVETDSETESETVEIPGPETDTETDKESDKESEKESEKETETETDEPASGPPALVRAEGMTPDFSGTYPTLSCTVDSETDYFDFTQHCVAAEGCTWELYADFTGMRPYPLKAISLNYGENVAYLIVWDAKHENYTRYKATILRPKTVEYSFVCEGRVVSKGKVSSSVPLDGKVQADLIPGKYFVCWACNGEEVSFPRKISENTVFEAVYRPYEYTITLNPDGGTTDVGSITVKLGDPFTLPKPTFGSQVFDGWYEGSKKWEMEGTFNRTENVVLSAHWFELKACGEGLTWSLDESATVLTVTGSGAMYDYSATNPAPWSRYSEQITRIVLDPEMTYIGSYAFSGMNALQSVNLNGKLTRIGAFAFHKCQALESVEFGSSLEEIAARAFYQCQALQSVSLPETFKTLGAYAFAECGALRSFKSGGATGIGTRALADCPALASLELGTAVQSIGDEAFARCAGLSELTIGQNVQSIGASAFAGCEQLAKLHFNAVLCSDMLPSAKPFAQAGNGMEVIFGPKVTVIPANLFAGVQGGLRKMTFADGTVCREIGENAFGDCIALESIRVPATVTRIGKHAFAGCTSVRTVYYEAENAAACDWMDWPFYNVGSVEQMAELRIGASVKTIPAYMFCMSANLDTLVFEERTELIRLERSAFQACRALAEVSLPARISYLAPDAFAGCAGLQNVHYADTVASFASLWGEQDLPSFVVVCTDGNWPDES